MASIVNGTVTMLMVVLLCLMTTITYIGVTEYGILGILAIAMLLYGAWYLVK